MSAKTLKLLDKINRIAGGCDLDSLSKLEYDLLLQYVRDFYEAISDYNTDLPVNESESVKQHYYNEDTQATSTLMPPAKMDVEEYYIVANTESKVNQDVKPDEVKKIPCISDLESHGGSLNDKLKSTSANEIHKKLSSKPLKELVDLNKKFVIVNELFNGDQEAFAATVKAIDSYTDFNSAQSFVQSSVAEKYGWDESVQSVRMFNKLIRQKFGVE